MSTISVHDIKTLEQTRQRLAQLTSSLDSLQRQIINSDPLPPWASLHSQTQILSQNLAHVSTLLKSQAPLLEAMAVYPLPSYPGRDQESLLQQLVRKKLDPGVEDWVEKGRVAGESVALTREGRGAQDTVDLWEWAGMAANEQARKHDWGGDYTLEEMESGIENVVTGLRGDDESEEDEQDERMTGISCRDRQGPEEVDGPMLPIGDMLKYVVRGAEPKR